MKALLKTRIGRLLVTPAVLIAFGFQGVAVATPAMADCLSMQYMESLSSGDGFYETCGGDDLSYKIPINGSVIFGGITYTSIFATGNSIITFGQQDSTYDTFPSTPSISLDSYDWVQRGFYDYYGTYYPYGSSVPRTDEYFNITVEGNTFRVDIAARPYSGYSATLYSQVPDGDPRLMSLYFVRNSDGTLRIRSFTSNSTDPNLRNGCVLSQGATPISLEECGIFEVASLSELEELFNPIDYLVAISPVTVEESGDSIICKSAQLKYMVQGTQATNANLNSQTYSLELDGKVVAQINSLDSSVKFAKSSVNGSGVLACVQVARQGDASMTIESANAQSISSANSLREKQVNDAKKDYFETVQKLGIAKSEALKLISSGQSSLDYKAVSEEWKSKLAEAQLTRDAAIAAAIAGASDSLVKSGAYVLLGN